MTSFCKVLGGRGRGGGGVMTSFFKISALSLFPSSTRATCFLFDVQEDMQSKITILCGRVDAGEGGLQSTHIQTSTNSFVQRHLKGESKQSWNTAPFDGESEWNEKADIHHLFTRLLVPFASLLLHCICVMYIERPNWHFRVTETPLWLLPLCAHSLYRWQKTDLSRLVHTVCIGDKNRPKPLCAQQSVLVTKTRPKLCGENIK